MVTLSAQDNEKPLQQLEPGFKRRINWNKYQPKVSIEIPNQYLHYFIGSSFQRVKRPFVLFTWKQRRTPNKLQTIFLPDIEIKDYNIMIDGQNVFDQPVKTIKKQNIW